jgi:rhodanese-related sulfurtransferase
MQRIKLISIEEFLEMMLNKEDFKLVEVLSAKSYGEGHIPRAINIPLREVEERAVKELKKTDNIVTYCSSYACEASTKATRKLLEMGYENTLEFKAGKRGWVHAGLKLEI